MGKPISRKLRSELYGRNRRGPEPTSRSGLGDLKDEIDQERAKKRDRSRDRDRDRRRDRSRDRRDRSRSRGRRDRDRGGREPREDRMKEERSYEEEGEELIYYSYRIILYKLFLIRLLNFSPKNEFF